MKISTKRKFTHFSLNFLKAIPGSFVKTGLYFQNKRTYSSALGGLLSLIVYLAAAAYTVVIFVDVLNRGTIT